MPADLLWYVFYLLKEYGKERTERIINEVLIQHNQAVRKSQEQNGYFHIDTSHFGDAQCVLSSMLDREVCYRQVVL